MDQYHVWADLRRGEPDLEFVAHARRYLEHLKAQGLLVGFRISRRKLGFGPEVLGEFHLLMETRDLGQLEATFLAVAKRAGETERLHREVSSRVENFRSALYRDFPDLVRESIGRPTA